MVTIVEVARRAGVSTATVSRVVNNPAIVEKKTRQAVQAVIAEADYRPNAMAQGLVSQSSKTIGVVINQFSSSYYGRMLDGVESSLSEVGFKTIAESSRQSAEGELSAIASLVDRQCEGIVLHSDKLEDNQLVDLLSKHPNLILMNRPLDGFEGRCVYIDNIQGGKAAASYLCDAHHRDFAIVTGPMSFFECCNRLDGFKREIEARGIHIDPNLIIESDFASAGGRVAMEQILESKKPVSAIFFMNDEMAAGAIDVCLENGVSLPADISILGCDDLDIAKFIYPKLTTLHQPLVEVGVAAGVLAHAIATRADLSNCKRVFDITVIERASVVPFISQIG